MLGHEWQHIYIYIHVGLLALFQLPAALLSFAGFYFMIYSATQLLSPLP
jgi:hypothetical protein